MDPRADAELLLAFDEAQVLLRDPDGRIRQWSRGCERLYGWTAEQAVGAVSHDLLRTEFPTPITAIEATLTAKGRWHGELRHRRKDGHPVDVASYWALSQIDGRPVVIEVNNDISDRVRAERAEAAFHQAQKMEAVGQLTGGVAHDFNNLLAVVLGNLELLSDAVGAAPDLKVLVEEAITAVTRGAVLTRSLLAFSRRQPLSPANIVVDSLLGDLVGLLRRTLGEAIIIQIGAPRATWLCRADPGLLQNAIINLAVNARDAMPNGGGLTIESADVTLDDGYAENNAEVIAGDYVMIAVSDTGVGMTDDVRARAFEPFFTTKGPAGGSGLGLSMVYGFIKQSSGHVGIYSEPGTGTTVKLYLPRALDGGESVAEAGTKAPLSRGGETVLVVEDDPALRRSTIRILGSLGYATLEAATAGEALTILVDNQPSLLLTDIVLPAGMNGRELAEAAQNIYPELRVLYMSGYTGDAILNRGQLPPGTVLLQKPFSRRDLAEHVRRQLN